jgi:LemA protein
MNPMWIALAGAAVVVVWFVVSFNRFVSQRQLIRNSWSNVETELRRRYDLIPNLVETVRGYAAHESSTLVEVTEARRGALEVSGGAETRSGPENLLTQGLKQLLAVSEAYPELAANHGFLDLQRQLVTTEDRIQAARRLYNGNVRDHNRRVEAIPSRVLAAVFRFRKEAYFEVEPAVRLSGPPPVGHYGGPKRRPTQRA